MGCFRTIFGLRHGLVRRDSRSVPRLTAYWLRRSRCRESNDVGFPDRVCQALNGRSRERMVLWRHCVPAAEAKKVWSANEVTCLTPRPPSLMGNDACILWMFVGLLFITWLLLNIISHHFVFFCSFNFISQLNGINTCLWRWQLNLHSSTNSRTNTTASRGWQLNRHADQYTSVSDIVYSCC